MEMNEALSVQIGLMSLTYAFVNRVFMKYCMIFLSKMGFYLGKDFLEVNECNDEWFQVLRLFQLLGRGLGPSKIQGNALSPFNFQMP